MSRKIAKILSALILSTPLTGSVSLSSCSNKDFNMYISEAERTKAGKDYSYIFKFSCSVKPEKGLRAWIVGDDDISCPRDIDVTRKDDIEIKVDISPWLDESKIFTFGIKFENKDTLKTTTVTNLSIDFTYETPEYDIEVSLDNPLITQTMDYTFDFKFTFKEWPAGQKFSAKITSGPRALTIPQPICTVEQQPTGEIVGIVTVKLDPSTLEDVLYPLNLAINFNNQIGLPLWKFFDNCGVSFHYQKQENMPVDYLLIEDNVVKGIDNRVAPEEVSKYKFFEIPDGVMGIAPNAFTPDSGYDFSNFNTIKLPKSLTTVPINTFKSFSSLFYIDMGNYTSWPNWFKTTSTDESVFSDDPTHSFKYNGGIVLVNDELEDKCSIRDEYVNPTFGLGTGKSGNWDVCSENEIIPDDYYTTVTDEETGEITVTGIKTEYLDNLSKYKIIKIPENTSVISDGAFCECFNGKPFIGDNNQTTYNRRFIPNRNLKKIGKNVFKTSSVGGYILFDCPNLEKIDEYAFTNSLFCALGGSYAPTKPDVWEDCGVFFRDCNKLATLGSNCFSDAGDMTSFTWAGWCFKHAFNLIVPKNVKHIGKWFVDHAYLDHLTFECPQITFDKLAASGLWKLQELDLTAISSEDLINNWKTEENSKVFEGLGKELNAKAIIRLGKRTKNDYEKIKEKLTSDDWFINTDYCEFVYIPIN